MSGGFWIPAVSSIVKYNQDFTVLGERPNVRFRIIFLLVEAPVAACADRAISPNAAVRKGARSLGADNGKLQPHYTPPLPC